MAKSYWLDEQEVHINQTEQEVFEAVPNTYCEILDYQKIGPNGEDRIVFDLVNAPPSHANALRRTLLSRVPSMAIELIGMINNTGVMPDELLCHRIGLIPINADWKQFDYPNQMSDVTGEFNDPDRCLLFGLNITGWMPTEKHPEPPENPSYEGANSDWEQNLPVRYTGKDGFVYSGDLVWLPYPGQKEKLGTAVGPLVTDIPITKLLPGQTIHLYARCVKGIGADHAKFSPVCTVYYRYVPKIEITSDFPQSQAENLVKMCPKHVFDIEDSHVVVKRPRDCTTCRECLRFPEFNSGVKLQKEGNRYEFTVESVGVKPVPVLINEAFEVLAHRCHQIKEMVNN